MVFADNVVKMYITARGEVKAEVFVEVIGEARDTLSRLEEAYGQWLLENPAADKLVYDQRGLSTRTKSSLEALGVKTLGQVAQMTEVDLRHAGHIGTKSIQEIRTLLEINMLKLKPTKRKVR